MSDNLDMDAKLRAALRQMDDIVKGSFDESTAAEENNYIQVKSYSEDLKNLLLRCKDGDSALHQLPSDTTAVLRDWLGSSQHSEKAENKTNGFGVMDETGYGSQNTSEMKILEHENESLKSQLLVLQTQIHETQHKVRDTEARLVSSNEKLMKAEDRLQKEQVNKTYLEAHKLDLMSEVAELRTRLQAVENEKAEYSNKYERLQAQVLELHESLIKRDREISELKSKLNRNGFISNGDHGSATGSYHGSLDREAIRARKQKTELDAMKRVVNELMTSNEEKDRKIEELRKAVTTYQRVEEIILQTHSSHPRSEDGESATSMIDRTVRAPIESEKQNGAPTATSTPVNTAGLLMINGNNAVNQFSTIAGTPTPKRPLAVQRSNSYDASKFNRIIVDESPKTSSRKNSCSSLPRDYNNRVNGHSGRNKKGLLHSLSLKSRRGSSGQAGSSNKLTGTLQKSFLVLSNLHKWTASAPHLVDNFDNETTDDEDGIIGKEHKKKRGIKKFFARLKRSTSQEAVDNELGTFKRGGVRSTAGPRLGWNKENKPKSEDFRTPFAKWDADQVATWLHDMGLTMYVTDCRRWCVNGQQLLDATQHEVDKELRISNPIHKKKIHLAIEAIRSGSRKDQLILNLRPDWISKWLDDIGLPQYKDQFYEARVDGRMLNFITVEDLLYMKITNALHHASIRRGIEVLRKHNFNLAALKRRPSLKSASDAGTSLKNSSIVDPTLWTNHRVMEWLRSIDLSEYAANLRGSGVHGALIMLEARFTVEHLASILNIPLGKTLLRRHLNAHFVNLVGQEVQSKKREAEQGSALPLALNTKVKTKRSNPFKKGRSSGEYVCPIDIEPIDVRKEDKRVQDAVAMYKKELNKRDSNKRDSGTKKTFSSKPITEYGQFSAEVRQLAGLVNKATEG